MKIQYIRNFQSQKDAPLIVVWNLAKKSLIPMHIQHLDPISSKLKAGYRSGSQSRIRKVLSFKHGHMGLQAVMMSFLFPLSY